MAKRICPLLTLRDIVFLWSSGEFELGGCDVVGKCSVWVHVLSGDQLRYLKQWYHNPSYHI